MNRSSDTKVEVIVIQRPTLFESKDRRKRLEALGLLGNKCVRCGEEDVRVLQINHRHNDGNHHQGKDRGANSGPQLARKIVARTVSLDDYEILCANCHMIVTYEALYAPIGDSEKDQTLQAE